MHISKLSVCVGWLSGTHPVTTQLIHRANLFKYKYCYFNSSAYIPQPVDKLFQDDILYTILYFFEFSGSFRVATFLTKYIIFLNKTRENKQLKNYPFQWDT